MASSYEHMRVVLALSSGGGAVIWSMRELITAGIMSGDTQDSRKLRKAYIQSPFCIVSALIGGATILPWIMIRRDIQSVDGWTLFGTLFGLMCWPLYGLVIDKGPRIVMSLLPPPIAKFFGKVTEGES